MIKLYDSQQNRHNFFLIPGNPAWLIPTWNQVKTWIFAFTQPNQVPDDLNQSRFQKEFYTTPFKMEPAKKRKANALEG